jgi:hypothetical protein
MIFALNEPDKNTAGKAVSSGSAPVTKSYKDTSGFPEDLGLRFDPATGEAYFGINFYNGTDDEPVTKWQSTGWTYFIDNYIVGPGMKQKAGVIAFATKETADKVAGFINYKVDPWAKVSVIETEWDFFKVVDVKGKHIPQYQVLIKNDDNNTNTKLNAGLVASIIIRAQNVDFAAEMIKSMLK